MSHVPHELAEEFPEYVNSKFTICVKPTVTFTGSRMSTMN